MVSAGHSVLFQLYYIVFPRKSADNGFAIGWNAYDSEKTNDPLENNALWGDLWKTARDILGQSLNADDKYRERGVFGAANFKLSEV
jgi:hypothetical protein